METKANAFPFTDIAGRAPLWMRVGKRIVQTLVVLHLVIFSISGYRAWYQVKSLELTTSGNILQPGVQVQSHVVSYARTTVDLEVHLIQGDYDEEIGFVQLPGNEFPVYNQRSRSGSLAVVITPDVLSRLKEGPALLRAKATGRPQWTRLPPPMVREIPVVIAAR